MDSNDSPGVLNLEPEDQLVSDASQPASKSPEADDQRYVSGVSVPVPQTPSNRLIYLDEDSMHAIGLRLISDPYQYMVLQNLPNNEYMQLKSLFDAQLINAAYFARRIWELPANEALMDIPPLLRDELYPGVMVRARALVKSRQDLRPDRLTLTNVQSGEMERIHVMIPDRGALSINRSFLVGQVLFVVGMLCRLDPLSLTAAAILLAPHSKEQKEVKLPEISQPIDEARPQPAQRGGQDPAQDVQYRLGLPDGFLDFPASVACWKLFYGRLGGTMEHVFCSCPGAA
jgi:hypothetical protein